MSICSEQFYKETVYYKINVRRITYDTFSGLTLPSFHYVPFDCSPTRTMCTFLMLCVSTCMSHIECCVV